MGSNIGMVMDPPPPPELINILAALPALYLTMSVSVGSFHSCQVSPFLRNQVCITDLFAQKVCFWVHF